MPHAPQRRTRHVATALSVAALFATSICSATPADATTSTTKVATSHPSWATAAADKGAVPAATTVTARIYLASQNAAGLAAYAKGVSDPASANYEKYLSAATTTALYGPSAANTAAVKDYLTAHGIGITAATAHYFDISGTAAQIQTAFGTTLHNYATATGTHHAPSGDLRLPTAVAAGVLSVVGLTGVTDTSARPDSVSVSKTVGEGRKTPANGVPEPCSTFWGQHTATGLPTGYSARTPTAPCPYYPAQLRMAYGVAKSGLSGSGATVAIVDAFGSATMLADANQYSTNHGDAAFRPGQYTEHVDPSRWNNVDACGGASSWAPEEALDVEMVHGYAPDANVVYVGADSCSDGDLLAAWQLIVDGHLADVVSNSWGEIMHGPSGYFDTSIIAPYEQTLQQAAVEGIGFTVSSGDCANSSPAAAATGVNCDANSTRAQTEWPASDPWVTAVGATALGISSSRGKYQFETSMGDERSALSADGTSWQPFPGFFYFGGGGGTSEDFAQPSYQQAVVPGNLAHTLTTGAHSGSAQRVVPDVALNGDLITATLVGISNGAPYSEGGYGGTSVSAPSFAGILADAIQAQHGAVGFANPVVYARHSLFTDVTEHPRAAHLGNETISAIYDLGYTDTGARKVRDYALGRDYGLTADTGFDNATGLGSPNAQFLDSFRRHGSAIG